MFIILLIYILKKIKFHINNMFYNNKYNSKCNIINIINIIIIIIIIIIKKDSKYKNINIVNIIIKKL